MPICPLEISVSAARPPMQSAKSEAAPAVEDSAFLMLGVGRFVKSCRIRRNVRFSGAGNPANVGLEATVRSAGVGLELRDSLRQINENCAYSQ